MVKQGAGPGGSGAGPAPRPQALIVTVYGLYAREEGGWLSVAALIRMLAELGVEEPAVRSSVSRLKRRDMVAPRRVDGAAGYALTATARSVLDEGDQRIFARPRPRLSDGWLLAVFSVPESERTRRHALRSLLSWLGFGTVSAGVWVAPAHAEPATRQLLTRHDLSSYVNLFRAEHVAFGDTASLVRQWWDLDQLQRMYDEFLSTYRPVAQSPAPTGAQAFADYVRTLTAWRRFPYLDPGLPDDVLPQDWHGALAADLFRQIQDQLAMPARDFVHQVIRR